MGVGHKVQPELWCTMMGFGIRLAIPCRPLDPDLTELLCQAAQVVQGAASRERSPGVVLLRKL